MQLSCPTRHYNSQLKNMCKLNNLFWFYYKDIKSRALVQCLQGPYDLSCESQRMLNIRKRWYRDTSLCEANLQLRYSTLSNPQDLFSTVVRWKKCILKTLFSLLILKYFQIFYLNLQNSISKATKGTLKKLIMGYFTLNKTTDDFSNWHLNEYFDSKLTNCILTIER